MKEILQYVASYIEVLIFFFALFTKGKIFSDMLLLLLCAKYLGENPALFMISVI